MAQAGSALLLIEDGVYAATVGSATEASLRQACATLKVYALQPDLDARGMTGKLIDGITLVDYAGFVDLSVEYKTSHSWL
jgi:tRNA 2-thiouridine synthesizing protein B